MKQSRNRPRGNNRRRAASQPPAVICPPGPRQASPPPRKEPEALRAFALTAGAEPLVQTAKTPRAPRGKARTAEVPLPPETPRLAEIAALPRNRALVVAPQKGLVAVKQWLRKLIMKPKKAALTVETASAKTQVRALRVEVAQLQRSLDQLMAQLKAIQ
jgi:hypothetical protein